MAKKEILFFGVEPDGTGTYGVDGQKFQLGVSSYQALYEVYTLGKYVLGTGALKSQDDVVRTTLLLKGLVTEKDGALFPAEEYGEITYELRGSVHYDESDAHLMSQAAGKASHDTKPTNPKDAIGSDKLPLHLWPVTATVGGSLAMLDGMLKYGRANWREAGIRPSIYVDAAERHLKKYFEGQDNDDESGLPHLYHALACIAIMIDATEAGKLNDDRQYPGGALTMMERLTPEVARIKARHKDRQGVKHWTIGDKA